MPLYEYRQNAENSLPLPEETRKSITVGTAASCQKLLEQFAGATAAGAPGVMLIDGWYGVDWASLRKGLAAAARQSGLKLVFASTAGFFRHDLSDYRKKFVSEDPSFGWVNKDGTLADVLDTSAVAKLSARLADTTAETLFVVLGPGAAIPELAEHADLVAYADFTMQPAAVHRQYSLHHEGRHDAELPQAVCRR